jgi:hypothetical protein
VNTKEKAMYRRLAFALLMTAAFGATHASAQNFSEPQRNVMENMAQAFAGTGKCTRYEVNAKLIVLIQLRYGVNIASPMFRKYIEERAKFHRDRIASRTEEDICEAVNRLFGPQGTNTADLIRPKR